MHAELCDAVYCAIILLLLDRSVLCLLSLYVKNVKIANMLTQLIIKILHHVLWLNICYYQDACTNTKSWPYVWRFSILLPCRDSYAQELPFELFRLLHSTVGLLYLLMEQNKSVRYMVKGFSNVSHSMKFHIGVFIHELSIHLAPHCRNNCCCIDIIGISILPIYSDVEPSRLLP